MHAEYELLYNEAIERYKDMRDQSHGWDGHVKHVVNNAVDINEKLGLGLRVELLMLAAAWHDVAQETHRETHHLEGALQFIEAADRLAPSLSMWERYQVTWAIREHRASYTDDYSTMYSEVISAADRGKPDAQLIINRAWYHTQSKGVVDDRECAIAVAAHMREKFSSTGYQRLPELYIRYWGDGITAVQTYFDDITADEVLAVMRVDNG